MDRQEYTSFKNQLIDKIKLSPEWQLIKKHFSNSKISDILLWSQM